MAHRNGLPKSSATERTKYRWRMRHEIPTVQDKKRSGLYDYVKSQIYRMRHPEEFN